MTKKKTIYNHNLTNITKNEKDVKFSANTFFLLGILTLHQRSKRKLSVLACSSSSKY